MQKDTIGHKTVRIQFLKIVQNCKVVLDLVIFRIGQSDSGFDFRAFTGLFPPRSSASNAKRGTS
jgi:hypothetical protein